MPLAQRLPKLPGFKNPFKKIYSVVNLSKLSRFEDGAKVDADSLVEAGLVHAGQEIRILGTGGLKRKLNVEAHSFSVSAREAIEKQGGSVKVLGEPRKIGPRRTAAKLPKPLPTETTAAKPAPTEAEAKPARSKGAPRGDAAPRTSEGADAPEPTTQKSTSPEDE
jgi:ribosomal protein L18E